MVKRLFIIALLLFSLPAFAATRTATVSGDWSNTATWGGADVPISGDLVRISGDVVVTVSSAQACNHVQIAISDNSTGTAELILNDTLTVDASGTITVGMNTNARDGKLTFGPGGHLTLASGTGTFTMQNGYLRTTSTSENWAKITGGWNIGTGGTGPKQDIVLSYLSFQNTGNIYFYPQNTTGGGTPQIDLDNNVFYGCNIVRFGSNTLTPNTVPISAEYNDFRDFGSLTIQRVTGGVATYEFNYNTVGKSATVGAIALDGSDGLSATGNVFWRYTLSTSSTTGGHTFTNNFMGRDDSLSVFADLDDTAAAWTLDGNYIYYPVDNAHMLQTSGAATGSGTHTLTGNIFECTVWTTDGGDAFMPGATPLGISYTGNIAINISHLTQNNVSDSSNPFETNGLDVEGNTCAITDDTNHYGYMFFGAESNPQGGTGVDIANNLGWSNGTDGANTSIYSHAGNVGYTIDSSDYNNHHDTTPYSNVAVSAGKTADQTVDPAFVDTSRNMGTWNQKFGSGTNSHSDAVTYLLAINGYRGTPNFDQQGTASTYGPAHLVEWVSYGFSPTAGEMRNAGDDGGTIGAVEWQNPRRKR